MFYGEESIFASAEFYSLYALFTSTMLFCLYWSNYMPHKPFGDEPNNIKIDLENGENWNKTLICAFTKCLLTKNIHYKIRCENNTWKNVCKHKWHCEGGEGS